MYEDDMLSQQHLHRTGSLQKKKTQTPIYPLPTQKPLALDLQEIYSQCWHRHYYTTELKSKLEDQLQ